MSRDFLVINLKNKRIFSRMRIVVCAIKGSLLPILDDAIGIGFICLSCSSLAGSGYRS